MVVRSFSVSWERGTTGQLVRGFVESGREELFRGRLLVRVSSRRIRSYWLTEEDYRRGNGDCRGFIRDKFKRTSRSAASCSATGW